MTALDVASGCATHVVCSRTCPGCGEGHAVQLARCQPVMDVGRALSRLAVAGRRWQQYSVLLGQARTVTSYPGCCLQSQELSSRRRWNLPRSGESSPAGDTAGNVGST